MKVIKIQDIDVNSTIDIVRELRAQGLVQGIDFDFSYNKPVHKDWITWDQADDPDVEVQPRNAAFTFYDDKYATLFALRYASK